MNTDYLLSIVIPTKNRQIFCKKVILQVLSSTSEITEIIIQDNSDNDSLSAFVEELKTDRVKLHRQTKEISFVENFSEALSYASGKYICMIGDDDGVLPNIEEVTKYAEINNFEAVIPGLNAVYIWPSDNPIVKNGENGFLTLTYIKDNISIVKPKDGFIKLLKQGFQDYQQTNIPRLYHGIVCKNILEKIKTTKGAYFGGLTPDMYMSVALSFLTKRVILLSFPITISGICPQSASAASATGKHTGKLTDAPHFIGHKSYTWDERVPEFYSVETIWADTALYTIKDFSRNTVVKRITLKELYSRLWLNYSDFRNEIRICCKNNNINLLSVKCRSIEIELIKLFRKIINRITRKKGDVLRFYNVNDIAEAMEITNRVLDERNINIMIK